MADSETSLFRAMPKWLLPSLTGAHAKLYQLSSGRLGARVGGLPVLLLRTIGRRSGNPHTVALPYVDDADDQIILAAYPGSTDTPAWFLNLRANPEVVVQVQRRAFWAWASVLEEDDRAAMWDKISTTESPLTNLTSADGQVPIVRLTYSRPFTG